jgi:hypothetical protein
MFFEAINNFFTVALGKWLAIDHWYKVGMGANFGGFTLAQILPDSDTISTATTGIWDSVLNNPVSIATAFGVLLVNLVAAWQKVQQNRREEERHQQELEQDRARHEAEFNTKKDSHNEGV